MAEGLVLGLGIPLVIILISVVACLATEIQARMNLRKRERID
jgi:hypothetical protein